MAKIGGGQESGNGDRGGKMLIFKVHFLLALLEDFSSTFLKLKTFLKWRQMLKCTFLSDPGVPGPIFVSGCPSLTD